MADGFHVDTAQLHRHAEKVLAVRDQLAAIKDASRAIAQDDAAYGLLCAWMAGILEARHVSQDELYRQVEENLSLVAKALIATAKEYETSDSSAADRIRRSGGAG